MARFKSLTPGDFSSGSPVFLCSEKQILDPERTDKFFKNL